MQRVVSVVLLVAVVAGDLVRVQVEPQKREAVDMNSLTAVTIDVCILKLGLDFNDPLLNQLTAHIGGGNTSVLRIGGSDQNSFSYTLQPGKMNPCNCHEHCEMTSTYWDSAVAFASRTGHQFIFGLQPDEKNATGLIEYAARKNQSILAFTYGNEIDSTDLFAGYAALRKTIDSGIFVGQIKPLLAGPDVALQRHAPLAEALEGRDSTILDRLNWVDNFTKAVGHALDVVTWHTYDFHANEVGTEDHQPLNPSTHNTSRLWDTRYLDMATRLAGNMSDIRDKNTPNLPVWLTETNSVCHQGVANDTNAFLNSVWLVDRLGRMAEQGTPLMARQSLIGYNYSLLGNWPLEPVSPNPDYFTTLLFRRLVGRHLLVSSSSLPSPTSFDDMSGEAFRTFAFCGTQGPGSVVVALVNFASHPLNFTFALTGDRDEYILTPAGDTMCDIPICPLTLSFCCMSTQKHPIVIRPGYPFTSRLIALNGDTLRVGEGGELPKMDPRVVRGDSPLRLEPLTVAFAGYTDPRFSEACQIDKPV